MIFRLCRSMDCTERSLRGRRLKGKGKGVLGAAPKTPFPFPFKCLQRRLY